MVLSSFFVIAHGLAHASLAFAPDPADPETRPLAFFTTPERSWLFKRMALKPVIVQRIGIILVSLSALGFVLAGIFSIPLVTNPIARPLGAGAAIISILLLILFWHPWLLIGILLDVWILLESIYYSFSGP